MSTSRAISAATSSSAPSASSSSPGHGKSGGSKGQVPQRGAKMDDDAVWHADAVCAQPITVRGDFIVEQNSYLVHDEAMTDKTDAGLIYRHIKFIDVPAIRDFKSAIVGDSARGGGSSNSKSNVTADDVYTTSANPILDMDENVLLQTRLVHVTCNDESQLSALVRSSHASSTLARIWLCNRKTNPRDASFAVYPFEQVFAVIEAEDGVCSGLIVSYDGEAIDDYVSDAYHATEIDAYGTMRGMFEALLHLHCCGLVHNNIVPKNIALSSMAERILLHEVSSPPASFVPTKYEDMSSQLPPSAMKLSVRIGGFGRVSLLNLCKDEMCLPVEGQERAIPTFPGLTSGIKVAMPVHAGGAVDDDDEESDDCIDFAFKSPELLLSDSTRFNPRLCDVYGAGMIVAVFLANHVRRVDKDDIDPYFVSNCGRFSALHDIAAAWGACSFPSSWVYPSVFDSPRTEWHHSHLRNPFLFQRWTYDQARLLSDSFPSPSVPGAKGKSVRRDDDNLFEVPNAKQAAFEYEAAAFMNAHRISPFVATPDEITCSKVLPGYIVPSMFHFYTFLHSLEVVCSENQFDTEFFLQALFSAGKIGSGETDDPSARSVDAFVGTTLDLLQLLDGERPAMGGGGAPVAYVGGPARNMVRLLSRKRSFTKMTVGWWFAALNMLDCVDLSQIDDDTSLRLVQTLMNAARRTVRVMRIVTKAAHPDVSFRSNALDIVNEFAPLRDGQCFGMCRFSKTSAQMSRNSAHTFASHPVLHEAMAPSPREAEEVSHRSPSAHAVACVVEKMAIAAISNCPQNVACDTTVRVMIDTVLCFRSAVLRNDAALKCNRGNDLRALLSQMCTTFCSCLQRTSVLHGCADATLNYDADELLHSFNVLIERFVEKDGRVQFSELVEFVEHASSLDSLRNNSCLLSMASRQLWVKVEAKLPPLSVAPNWLFNPDGRDESNFTTARQSRSSLPVAAPSSKPALKEEEEEEGVHEKPRASDVEREKHRLSTLAMNAAGEPRDDDESMVALDDVDLDNETMDSNGSAFMDDAAVDLRWLYTPNAADDNLKDWLVSVQGEEEEVDDRRFSDIHVDEVDDDAEVEGNYFESDHDNNEDVEEVSVAAPSLARNTTSVEREGGAPPSPAIVVADDAPSGIGVDVTDRCRVSTASLPWLLVERFCETTDMLAAAYHAFLHNALNSTEAVSLFLSGYQTAPAN